LPSVNSLRSVLVSCFFRRALRPLTDRFSLLVSRFTFHFSLFTSCLHKPLSTRSLLHCYILSKLSLVISLLTFPVFRVPFGSNSITETSCSATGLCSTPRGTMMNSPSCTSTCFSRNSSVSCPLSTKNISSSLSCLCHTNGPINLANLTCCPFSSPTIFGLQWSLKSANFCAIFTFSIGNEFSLRSQCTMLRELFRNAKTATSFGLIDLHHSFDQIRRFKFKSSTRSV